MKIAVLNKCSENDKKACRKIIQYLKGAGNEIFELTPEHVAVEDEDLQFEISKASEWGAELIISCNFNQQSKDGCNIVYNKSNKITRNYAIKIAAYIEQLGFINRGAKQNIDIANAKVPLILIKPLYKK